MRLSCLATFALAGTLASCKLSGGAAADGGTKGGVLSTLVTLVSFEGEIEMRTKSGAAVTGAATTFKFKGSRMRTEMSAFGIDYVTIMDMETKKSVSLDTKAHTYTESDLSASKPASASGSKVVATGRSDKVVGYSCDVYEIDDATGPVAELCVASGIRMVAFGLSGPFGYFSGSNDAWGEAFSHGFPLRMSLLDATRSPLMTLEATRVEKKSEPDALFEPPAGYREVPPPGGTPLGGSGSSPGGP